MSFPRYERYKDSGVEWLGEVPKHWDVWKVTHGFNRIGSGTTPKSENALYYDGDVPWVTTSELRESIILETAKNVTREAVAEHSALKLYPVGSIAMAMYGATIGRLGKFGVDATVNQACCVFSDPTVFDADFFYYWLWMRRPILISLSNGGGQPNLSQDDLKKLWVPIPDIEEQQTIARFLDHKTAQIDALIAKKEALLEKLAERRTALISHAVTKGLNPQAKMKDSGVEWLGKVSAHWETKRLKFTVTLINEKIDATLSDLSYMGLEHIESWSGRRIEGGSANSEGIASHFIEEDVLFGKLRPYLAKVYLAKHEGLVSTEALVLRSLVEIDACFLRYYMVSREFIEIVNGSTFGSKMPRASWDFVGNLPMLLPEYHEQQTIARFLDHKTAQIDIQAEKVRDAIEKLKEYRSALITQAVTGKIDVRRFSSNPAGKPDHGREVGA